MFLCLQGEPSFRRHLGKPALFSHKQASFCLRKVAANLQTDPCKPRHVCPQQRCLVSIQCPRCPQCLIRFPKCGSASVLFSTSVHGCRKLSSHSTKLHPQPFKQKLNLETGFRYTARDGLKLLIPASASLTASPPLITLSFRNRGYQPASHWAPCPASLFSHPPTTLLIHGCPRITLFVSVHHAPHGAGPLPHHPPPRQACPSSRVQCKRPHTPRSPFLLR